MSGLDTYQTIMATIGGTIGIIAIIIQSIRWVHDYQIKKHPWLITFSLKKREEIKTDSDMPSSIKIPIGETKILLRAKTLRPTNLTHTFIRPVNSNWHIPFPEGDEPMKIIAIDNIEYGSPPFDVELDNQGGVKLHHKEPYQRPQTHLENYYVTVKAMRKWEGKMMFSAEVNDIRRHVYGEIEVVDSEFGEIDA